MSRWNDPEWPGLISGELCPICRQGTPTNVIVELECSWLTMGNEPPGPPLPGTCALFHRRHAVELHDLTPEEATALMRDVQRVSRALAEAATPVKVNYEVHGNTIPHLHVHFFPRYPGDPFENGPIDARRHGTPETLERHRRIRERLLRSLSG